MIYIVLPAYNEEENIRPLLEEISWHMHESAPTTQYTVVVVDDGSADGTAAAVEAYRQERVEANPGAIELIRHEKNRGLAEAIRTGLLRFLEQGQERDIVLIMDSDNTHTPGLILRMIRLVWEGNEVVIASRYRPGARVIGVPFSRQFLSWAGSMAFRVCFRIPNVRDYTCGYRAYRWSVIRRAFEMMPNFVSESGFSCMVDILLKMRKMKPAPIMAEVPLILRYDLKKGASKMDVGKTIRQTLSLMARRLLGRSD
jgi:dolichol-phosphate mannosyltransferase